MFKRLLLITLSLHFLRACWYDQAAAEAKSDGTKKASTNSNTELEEAFSISPFLDEDRGEKKFVLSQADLKYGHDQVRKMVASRPQMSKYVSPGDAIWNWCARQFGGECTGERYGWQGNDQPTGYSAWHRRPDQWRRGTISIDRIIDDGEECWACAIFELLNIRNDPVFWSLEDKVQRGIVSDDYCTRQSAWLEYKASCRLSDFCLAFWIPHAMRRNLVTHLSTWKYGLPPFEEWFQAFPKNSPYFQSVQDGVNYSTIGLRINSDGKITQIFPHSPAEQNDVRVNDQILAVGGRKIEHIKPQHLAHILNGPYGSSVKLTIRRGSGGTGTSVILIRSPVKFD